VLKIREPGDRRNRQAPAKKARVFENDIDTLSLKFGYCQLILSERKCPEETRTTTIESRRLHYFDLRDLGESRKVYRIVVHPGEHNRHNFTWAISIKGGEEVKQVIVAASPLTAGDIRKPDAKRSTAGQRACSWNQLT
jgi:hypothetical protein